MATTITTTISATVSEATISEPSEGYGSVDYTVTLTVGEREVEIECWGHCGWLAPGAHEDLDGSGLTCWGDAQPGGWRVCDGDGAHTGRPRVEDDRSPEPSDPITIAAAHLAGAEITPEMVPEWAAAIAALAATPEEDDERWEVARVAADAAREAVVAAVESALDRVSCDCPEPTADEVWEALGRSAEVDGAECVRAGRWIGCPLVAWRVGERTNFDWWPTEAPAGAIEAAKRAAADAAATAVEDAVAAITADDDE